jgi:hypothetical protein
VRALILNQCGLKTSDVIGQDRLCSQFLATPKVRQMIGRAVSPFAAGEQPDARIGIARSSDLQDIAPANRGAQFIERAKGNSNAFLAF